MGYSAMMKSATIFAWAGIMTAVVVCSGSLAAAQDTLAVSPKTTRTVAVTRTVATSSANGVVVAARPVASTQAAHRSLATHPKAAAAARPAFPYYIEFRSRSAQSYGHTFSIFGRLDAQGKILTKEVAGLHPFTESPIPWMVGHLVLVPSETGASDGDLEDQYVTARFRVNLTEEEYARVVGYIRQHQASSPVWHAVLYNCNAWVGDIAKFMGMEAPLATLQYPEEYITALRDMNINRHAAGMIGTPTKVEDANTLRAIALHQPLPKQKSEPAHETASVAIQNTQPSETNASW